MRKRLTAMTIALVAVIALTASAPRDQNTPETQTGEYRPPPPPEQPVAFSHQLHVAQGLTCTTCHAGAVRAERATLPPVTDCMTCHATVRTDSVEVQKLAGYQARREEVPWRRVYRLPTFVSFSHQVHAPADQSTTCDTCHGAVRDMTVVQKVKDTSMATCLACHTARSAPTRCDGCHEPR